KVDTMLTDHVRSPAIAEEFAGFDPSCAGFVRTRSTARHRRVLEECGRVGGAPVVLTHRPAPLSASAVVAADGLPAILPRDGSPPASSKEAAMSLTRHRNAGLKKRCACPRPTWS